MAQRPHRCERHRRPAHGGHGLDRRSAPSRRDRRRFGKTDRGGGAEAAPALAPLTGPPGRNLLSPQYGGRLVAAPTKAWSSANDDVLGPGTTVTFLDAFGIFGFQDDRPATFDRFGILVLRADENPATIEIAAGDALTGPFRPLAKVQILNLYVAANDGWQYFDLPKTTARYVRIKTSERHDHGTVGYFNELSLDEKPPTGKSPGEKPPGGKS